MTTDPRLLHNPDRRIFKYPLQLTDHQTITVRTHIPCIDLVHIGMQNGHITLWAENDTSAPQQDVDIFIVGTGNPMPNAATLHLGSVIDDHGYVWHVFTEHVHPDEDDEYDGE